MNKRILIYDPVPYKGGSKTVAQSILSELSEPIDVWVLTNNIDNWQQNNLKKRKLLSHCFFYDKTSGLFFYLKHLMYMMSLLSLICRAGRFEKVIGISGPTVDFALYLVNLFIPLHIIQLVQGSVPNSNVAGFGLSRAMYVFYLPSALESIQRALLSYQGYCQMTGGKYSAFINGIDEKKIKKYNHSHQVELLWAASLLKWKGLDLFIKAVDLLNLNNCSIQQKFSANICYIKPKSVAESYLLPCNLAENIKCFDDPDNLNDIRADSSIFVSTSDKEPFGLSILESMVAGLVVVIPSDQAYWDQQLIDGHNCLKYEANSVDSLVVVLMSLIRDSKLRNELSINAQITAKQYSSLSCYLPIRRKIVN